ncbi:MAG: CRISPR-associated endonuclease Cas1 [Armatimonadota bacterium]|nr:CRISPR-associated endonuclease Cas1 [Armatimonadota bacterium]
MSILTIFEFGVFLGKHSERLVIRKGGETIEEHPLINLEQVLVACPGVSISCDLIYECCERGIPITLLTYSGKPYAKVVSPDLTATIITRREQIAALNDSRSVELAKAFAYGKLVNQANLLRYFAKYRKQTDSAGFKAISKCANQIIKLRDELSNVYAENADGARETILNLEGRAGAAYWEGVKLILGDRAVFTKRKHRGAADAVNAMLNYGYGIIYSQVWSAITLAGLEPFAGFIHADRPGKPSLVLDMVEEFRQPIVDQPLIAAIRKGFKIEMEAADDDEDARLSDASRREIAKRILARLEDKVSYEGKKWELKSVIQLQCRRVASYLRGERDYKPFISKW